MRFQRLAITTAASILAVASMSPSHLFAQEEPFEAANPFGAPAADPFGAPAQADPAAADPFGAAPPAADPFGAPAAPGQAADPFGAPAPTQDSPFGAPAAPADPASPFGAPADPFGAPAQPGAPADPFGAAPAQPAEEPLGGANIFSPFGSGASPFGPELGAVSDDVNPDGISQLYEFVYERVLRWDGEVVIARRQLTKEEAERFAQARRAMYVEQALAGTLENYAGTDPYVWAEWAHFAEQMQLWSEYADRVALAGRRQGDGVQSTYSRVQWPGTPESLRRLAQGQQTPADTNIINQAQNRSLDDQLNDFNPFAGATMGGQGGGDIHFSFMLNHVRDVYNVVYTALRDMEAEQEMFMTDFENRLLERSTARLAYRDWLDQQQENLLEFVQDWDRRYHGSITTIAGVRYELYRPGQVPSMVGPNSNVIVTDYQLTPYDIIDPETGLLRD